MASQVIAVRRANALMTDAQADLPPLPFRPSIDAAIRSSRRRSRGLWVGGTATLTDEALEFHANGMNRALHVGVVDAIVALTDVEGVSTRWGMVTRIVTVSTPRTALVLRCFGARRFAEQIRSAAGLS